MGKFYEGLYSVLSIHVRQSAWLNSTPDRKQPDPVSRLEAMKADGLEPEYPEVGAAEYLITYLFEVGPIMAAGMGSGPITHEELAAWQRNTGVDLQSWESRMLRRLSIDYLNESHRATKADCPAPYQPEELSHRNREAVAKKVSNSMRAYMLAQGNP